MDAANLTQRLLAADYRLAALETGETDRLLGLFKRLTLNSGQAVYHWSSDIGIYRLGVEHIFIPRTRMAGDALNYVAASRHYGIYLFGGFSGMLGKGSIQRTLLEIATRQDNVPRLILFMAPRIDIHEALTPHVAKIRPKPNDDAGRVQA